MDTVRWGILGTAGIAHGAFLPALREVQGGVAWRVGSRDLGRAQVFARENGVLHASGSYQSVLDDDQVDAFYIPLPNHLHYEWAMAAMNTGKPILCEKPLTGSLERTRDIVRGARERGALLWEAYAFQFQPQWQRVRQLITEGAIGELEEIHGTFNTQLHGEQDVRWVKAYDGGAFNDLGCYPVHVTQLLMKSLPDHVVARAQMRGEVDEAVWAALTYPGDATMQLLMNVSFCRRYDTFTRFVGTEGEIRVDKMYHPGVRDCVELLQKDRVIREFTMTGQLSFTDMISHIHQVMRHEAEPTQLVTEVGLATAEAMELVRSQWTVIADSARSDGGA